MGYYYKTFNSYEYCFEDTSDDDTVCGDNCDLCGSQYSETDSSLLEYTQCLECSEGYYLDWDSDFPNS